MAAESSANRNMRILNEDIDQLIGWTELQYNFLDEQMTDLLNDVINPKFVELIRSATNQTEKDKHIHEMEGVRKFIVNIRGHKEDTGRADHIGYEKLLIDLRRLKKEISEASNASDIDRIKQELRQQHIIYDNLNIEFNKFIKRINRWISGAVPKRFLSKHFPLSHEIIEFKFRNRNRSPSRPIVETRRGRSKNRNTNTNHSNVTHPARARSRSAIRNQSRPRGSRGSIHFNETARGPITFHKSNVRNRVVVDPSNPFKMIIEPGMTFTSGEVKEMGRRGTNNIYALYQNRQTYRNRLSKWSSSSDARESTNAVATEAYDAVDEAKEAAAAAQQAASSSPEAQAAAAEAATAARHARYLANSVAESFSLSRAQHLYKSVIKNRNIALAARDTALRIASSSPPSAAASSSSSSSNRRNST